MKKEKPKSMRIQAVLRTRMEGLGKNHTVYVEVAPFGLPRVEWKHLWARRYDELTDAQKDYKLVESMMFAIFHQEGVKLLRPEEEVRSSEQETSQR